MNVPVPENPTEHFTALKGEVYLLSGIAHVRSLGAASDDATFAENAREFVEKYQPGDKVIKFCIPIASRKKGLVSSGYRLVRGGVGVAQLVLSMN